jgi:tetratricopeptide (TPR) repeat protein
LSNIKQVEEQLQDRINHTKMLIRSGKVGEALLAIDEIEQEAEPHQHVLPPALRYLIPFTRGRAYMQIMRSDLATPELETAFEIAGEEREARARVQNLLGALLYSQEQPIAAKEHHLACARAINEGEIKDFNFRFSVNYNLANDYLASDDIPHAIGSYKEALRVLEDLDAPERQADVFWGLTMAYRIIGDWRNARLHAARAIEVYKSTGNRPAQAAVQINLAEILIDQERDTQAARVLEHTLALLEGTDSHGLMSHVHRYYADLARRSGDLERAAQHAEESLRQAEMLTTQGQDPAGSVWIQTTHALVESLHAAALVEEARGNPARGDDLFKQAIDLMKQTTVESVKRAIHLSYGAVLEARGAYKEAVEQFRVAAGNPPARSRLAT